MRGGSNEASVTLFLVGCVALGGIGYLSSGTMPTGNMAAPASIVEENAQAERSPETDSIAPLADQQPANLPHPFPELRFEDFPAESPGQVGVVPSFIGDQAAYSNFRTLLRSAAKDAPNFAGYMIVVSHGCGTECTQYMMINSRTGQIVDILPADIDTDVTQHVLRYSSTSNLMLEAFKDSLNDEGVTYCHDRAYRWTGNKLLLLASTRDRLAPDRNDCGGESSDQE